MKKKTIWVLTAVVALITLAWWGYQQLKIDSCLDSGGRWNYEILVCER
jgi:hypothetical protein